MSTQLLERETSSQLQQNIQEKRQLEQQILSERERRQLEILQRFNIQTAMNNDLNKLGGILEKLVETINSIEPTLSAREESEGKKIQKIKVSLHCNREPKNTRADMKCMEDWIQEAWQKLQNAKIILEGESNEQNEQLYLAAFSDYIECFAYVGQASHAIKSPESTRIKIERGKKVSEMTDLTRETAGLENPVSENDLPKIVEATIGVFLQNKLVIDGEEYEWFMKQTDIDAKFRDSGYSDMTLIFRANVKGKIVCFELQINTQGFIDAKVIETEHYQAKKLLINLINNLLQLIAEFHGKKASKIKLSKMDNMMKILLEKGLLEQLTKDSSLASKEKVLSFIAPFLRSHINFDIDNLGKKELKEGIKAIANTFDRGNFVVSELFKAVCDFAKHFKKGREAYEGIGGVIKSPTDADEIDKKARKLPNAKAILERGEKEPNTIIKRV